MSLDELAREGARRMLAVALEAEVDVYLAALAELVDERGHRLVRRNGHAPARQLATGAGQVEVVRPGARRSATVGTIRRRHEKEP
jgi:putative transposase